MHPIAHFPGSTFLPLQSSPIPSICLSERRPNKPIAPSGDPHVLFDSSLPCVPRQICALSSKAASQRTAPSVCWETAADRGEAGEVQENELSQKTSGSKGGIKWWGVHRQPRRIDFTPAACVETSGANHTQGVQPRAHHFIYNSLCHWLEHSRPQYVPNIPNVCGSICLSICLYYRDSQQQQTRSWGQKSIKRCVSRRLGFISFHGLS